MRAERPTTTIFRHTSLNLLFRCFDFMSELSTCINSGSPKVLNLPYAIVMYANGNRGPHICNRGLVYGRATYLYQKGIKTL